MIQAKSLDIPDAAYRKLKSMNASKLKIFANDKAQYYRQYVAKDIPTPPPTAAMSFGTLLHQVMESGGNWQDYVIEEPEELVGIKLPESVRKKGIEHFVDVPESVLSNGNRRGKKYLDFKKEADEAGKSLLPAGLTIEQCVKKANFLSEAGGREIIKPGEFCLIRTCVENLMKNRWIRYVASLPSRCKEDTILWRHPASGILCKSRLDVISEEAGCIVDWKTTGSVNRRKLVRSMFDFNYPLSAAFYQQAVTQLLGGEVLPFYFVFIEKTGGCDFAIVEASEWLPHAHQLVDKLLLELKNYDFSSIYKKKVETLPQPRWASDAYAEQLQITSF